MSSLVTETTNFNNLTLDICCFNILPKLWAVDVGSLSCASKAILAIIKNVAKQSHEDRNILGGRIFVNFNGSIPKFLFHKQKLDVLEDILIKHPEFDIELKNAAIAGETEAKKVASVSNWCDLNFIFKNAKDEVKPLIVLFDLNTNQLDKDCICTASFSDSQLHSPELLRSILIHSKAADLPGNGFPPTVSKKVLSCLSSVSSELEAYTIIWSCHLNELGNSIEIKDTPPQTQKSLGLILQHALNTHKISDEDKLKYIKVIFAHRNAKDICCEELQSVLTYAVRGDLCNHGKWCGGNPEIVKALLSHPNAIQIPISTEEGSFTFSDINSLTSMLEDAKKIGNREMIKLLQAEIVKRWSMVKNTFESSWKI